MQPEYTVLLSGNVVNRTELRVKHDIAMFCRRFSHESVRGSIHRVRACGGCACIPLPPFPEFSLVIPGNNRVQAASARPLFGAVQAGKKALRRTLSSGRLRFRGCDVRLCASFSLSLSRFLPPYSSSPTLYLSCCFSLHMFCSF